MYVACPKPFKFTVTKTGTNLGFRQFDECKNQPNVKACVQSKMTYFPVDIEVTCALFDDVQWGDPINLLKESKVNSDGTESSTMPSSTLKSKIGIYGSDACSSKQAGKATLLSASTNPDHPPFSALRSWDASKLDLSLALLPEGRNRNPPVLEGKEIDNGLFYYNGDNSQTYNQSSIYSVIPVAIMFQPSFVAPDGSAIPSKNPVQKWQGSKISAQEYFDTVLSPSPGADYSAVPLQSSSTGILNRFNVPVTASLYQDIFPVNQPNMPPPKPEFDKWKIDYSIDTFTSDDACLRLNTPQFQATGSNGDYCHFFWQSHSRPFVVRMYFTTNTTQLTKQYIQTDVGTTIGILAGFASTLFGLVPMMIQGIFFIKDKLWCWLRKRAAADAVNEIRGTAQPKNAGHESEPSIPGTNGYDKSQEGAGKPSDTSVEMQPFKEEPFDEGSSSRIERIETQMNRFEARFKSFEAEKAEILDILQELSNTIDGRAMQEDAASDAVVSKTPQLAKARVIDALSPQRYFTSKAKVLPKRASVAQQGSHAANPPNISLPDALEIPQTPPRGRSRSRGRYAGNDGARDA